MKIKTEIPDSGYSPVKVKKEPKFEHDVKPNIARIKSEFIANNVKTEVKAGPSNVFSNEGHVSANTTASKSRQEKSKKRKTTKRKRTTTRKTAKPRKKRKTKTKRKRQPISAEQRGIRNARMQLANRLGVNLKNKSVPSVNKKITKTFHEMKADAGIATSLNGHNLSAPSISQKVPHRATSTLASMAHSSHTNDDSGDVLNAILNDQSQFLSKNRNYEIQKDGLVCYSGSKKPNQVIENVGSLPSCVKNLTNAAPVTIKCEHIKNEVFQMPLIKQERMECEHKQVEDYSNISRVVKCEFDEDTKATVKCEDMDIELIEVKKEKVDIPVITLDSPKIESPKSEREAWFDKVKLEVKSLLKPYFRNNEITEDEYKLILKKSVPKVCNNTSNTLNIIKLNQLILDYVKKMKAKRKTEIVT